MLLISPNNPMLSVQQREYQVLLDQGEMYRVVWLFLAAYLPHLHMICS